MPNMSHNRILEPPARRRIDEEILKRKMSVVTASETINEGRDIGLLPTRRSRVREGMRRFEYFMVVSGKSQNMAR